MLNKKQMEQIMTEVKGSGEKYTKQKYLFKEAHEILLKLSPRERTEMARKAAEKRGYY